MSSRASIIKARLEDCPALAGKVLAFVGLGANLDSRAGTAQASLHSAMESLVALSECPVLVSSIWETTPLDCPPDSPRFFNAVAVLVPGERSPAELLQALQQIENSLGRVRVGLRNAPRTLDLDLLSYGDVIQSSPVLTLPHPRMHERQFVLTPLLEIAPAFVVPGKGEARQWQEKIGFQGPIFPINSGPSL